MKLFTQSSRPVVIEINAANNYNIILSEELLLFIKDDVQIKIAGNLDSTSIYLNKDTYISHKIKFLAL